MKFWVLAAVICGCSGCTTMSLKRRTVSQMDSAVDLRYRQVMDNLALVANDPSALPSYASVYSGTIFVQDQAQFVSTNIFPFTGTRAANPSIGANPSLNRQVAQNWALDPITSPEKLEAIRAACQWAIGGPEHVHPGSMSLLIRPDEAPVGPDRHFGVRERLAQLPQGWLGVGCHKDVPACARYKSHSSGNTWVWVTPEGMKGFTEFALIIQDIARVSINSQTLFHTPPAFTPIVFEAADDLEGRLRTRIQAYVNHGGQLVTDVPYTRLRLDTLGSDNSNLRSAIGAAGISSVGH